MPCPQLLARLGWASGVTHFTPVRHSAIGLGTKQFVSNCLAEGEEMDRRYVEQADRAERLAREFNDKLTVERLLAYAAECRLKLDAVALVPQIRRVTYS
jgi:hypothetical protein